MKIISWLGSSHREELYGVPALGRWEPLTVEISRRACPWGRGLKCVRAISCSLELSSGSALPQLKLEKTKLKTVKKENKKRGSGRI